MNDVTYDRAADVADEQTDEERSELGLEDADDVTDEEIADLALEDARNGDADSQCLVAVNFQYGWDGVRKDTARALHWYRLAAAQGYPHALFNLGCLYDTGDGVPETGTRRSGCSRSPPCEGTRTRYWSWTRETRCTESDGPMPLGMHRPDGPGSCEAPLGRHLVLAVTG